jgi:hypothetical protein
MRPKGLCQGINFNDTIWNRTRDVPVCSVVPQPTAPPRASIYLVAYRNVECDKFYKFIGNVCKKIVERSCRGLIKVLSHN